MGNLREIKFKMKSDTNLGKTLIRCAKDEILIDVDGDGLPDVALMDSTADGNIDTLAVDLTGDGEFNLYFHDSDASGLPDMVLIDSEGTGDLQTADLGSELEEKISKAADDVFSLLEAESYDGAKLGTALDELQSLLLEAQSSYGK